MPNTRHHTAKFKRCVEDVQKTGKSESSAYAICTAQFEKADEAIYDDTRAAAMRVLNFVGDRGPLRTEQHDGRDFVVVPVVALVEGVIHAMNAPHPEMVPLDAFDRALAEWDGKPIAHTHPVVNGTPVSIKDSRWMHTPIGFVRNARVEDRRLKMDAWIDPDKCDEGERNKVLGRVIENLPLEVSVGVVVEMTADEGEFNGRRYSGKWKAISPDHLAIFGDHQIGACSLAMGCGALRANMAVDTGAEIIDEPMLRAAAGFNPSQERDDHGKWTAGYGGTSAAREGDRVDVMSGLHKGKTGRVRAIVGEHGYVTDDGGNSLGFTPISDLLKKPKRVATENTTMLDKAVEYFKTLLSFGISDVQMRKTLEDSLRKVDADFASSGYVVEFTENPPQLIYQTYGLNSPSHMWRRDYSVLEDGQYFFGERVEIEPDPVTYHVKQEPRAACGCSGEKNNPPATPGKEMDIDMNREQKIAALAACPFNPVKNLKALQALTDDELTALEERTVAAKTASEKATADATALAAANTQIAALSANQQKPLTEAEWLAAAPKHVVDRFNAMKAADDAEAAKLITALAAAQTSFTEAELKDMALPQLRKLSAAVIKETPQQVDYSASGVATPRVAGAGDFGNLNNFEPPDPYAGATKQ